MSIQLNNDEDTFDWKLSTSGTFSVKSMYTDFMNGYTIYLKKYIWKLNEPLKIKIFMSKHNRNGCKKCVFCDQDESINHLFFECPIACLVWRVVHFTFNIAPPMNCKNMFANWLYGVDKDTKARIRVETCAIVWSLWNCRIDVLFNKKETAYFLHVIRMATHWIHKWYFLLLEAQRAQIWIVGIPV
jgi:hypothetical protein